VLATAAAAGVGTPRSPDSERTSAKKKRGHAPLQETGTAKKGSRAIDPAPVLGVRKPKRSTEPVGIDSLRHRRRNKRKGVEHIRRGETALKTCGRERPEAAIMTAANMAEGKRATSGAQASDTAPGRRSLRKGGENAARQQSGERPPLQRGGRRAACTKA